MSSSTAAAGGAHGEHRWDSAFAALYDRIMRRGEERSMGRRRSELVAKAHGRTLEIGAGTGFSPEHEDVHWKGVPPIVAPLVIGRAIKGSGA